jgi:catechol 2,3-dioxygenase-like lactoylglutathione lyase family enzyme
MEESLQRNERLFDAPPCETLDVGDGRPDVWVGHITLGVTDLDRANAFWTALGMRPIERNRHVAVLELRGGTHLVLFPASSAPESGTPVPFDLMVDDLDATHARWADAGIPVAPIERGRIHDSFALTAPDGYVVTVNSSHVSGPV